MKENLTNQNRSLFHLLLLMIFISGFYACEFDSHDDNYVHVEKPGDEVLLGIDLAGVNPEDVIYVTNYSYFTYTLYTDNREVLVRQFFLDGNPLETNQSTGTAILNTNITDKDIHELKLIIGLKTESGSLAEYAGLEMYVGEFTFKVKFISNSNKLNIRETTDNSGNLKLEWDKPIDYEVIGYDVYKGHWGMEELLKSINDPDESYFVDLDYAYGYKHYRIVTKVKNSYDVTFHDSFTVEYENLTEDNFETYRISTSEFYIKWENPNPFPCKYVLIYDYDKQIIVENGSSEAIIPDRYFPRYDSFYLYILPETADVQLYESYSYVYASYSDKVFNVFGAINFNVDIQHELMHALEFETLNSFDISSLEKISSRKHNLILDTGCQVQISRDGKVAIDDTYGVIHIYSDYSLTNKIAKLNGWNYPFYLVDNNKILIEQGNGFQIYDFITQKLICSKSWQPSDIYGYFLIKTSISSNGKYVYVQCIEYQLSENKVWTELFEIDNNNVTLLEKTDLDINLVSVSFHPLKPTEAVFQYSSYGEKKFVFIDILTKEKKEIKGEFMDIDLFTGNMLYSGEEYREEKSDLYVLDKDYTKEIIKIELATSSIWNKPFLLNNNLFLGGSYLNLSDLKEWKQ